jgi:hypothetical protein
MFMKAQANLQGDNALLSGSGLTATVVRPW